MSLKKTIFLIVIATAISILSWVLVLSFINPFMSSKFAVVLFFTSLLFSLMGVLTLVNLFFKIFFSDSKFVLHELFHSFRQAVLFSCLIVFGLVLESLQLLQWWNIVILVAITAVLEVMLINYYSQKRI